MSPESVISLAEIMCGLLSREMAAVDVSGLSSWPTLFNPSVFLPPKFQALTGVVSHSGANDHDCIFVVHNKNFLFLIYKMKDTNKNQLALCLFCFVCLWNLTIEIKWVILNFKALVHNSLFLTLIERVVSVFPKSLIACALNEGTRKISLRYAWAS